MKKVLIALLLLACAAVPAALIIMTTGQDRGAPPLGLPETAEDWGANATASETGSLERDLRASEDQERVQLRGDVRSPISCPSDATLEVFAFESAKTLHQVREFVFYRRDDQEEAHAHYGFLASSTLDENNEFSFELPASTESVHLLALGKFAFMNSTRPAQAKGALSAISLRPKCGALLRGQLIKPAASEVELAGTEVRIEVSHDASDLRPKSTNILDQRAVSASDGSFELIGVQPGSSILVTANPLQLATATATLTPLEAGETREVELVLARGATITGVVTDENGATIPGANVEAKTKGALFGLDSRVIRSARADEEGRFTLTAITPGPVRLGADASGYLASTPRNLNLKENERFEANAIELGRGHSIGGRLTRVDGSPVSDVEIVVSFDLNAMATMSAFNVRHGATGSARTDEKGAFLVTGLGLGPFTVTASEEREDGELRAQADGVQPDTEELALILQPGASLSGVVSDATLEPVRQFEVRALPINEGLLGSLGKQATSESFEVQDGRFVLTGLQAGRWRVTIVADGYGVSEPIELELEPGSVSEVLEFQLEAACMISGYVRNPLGIAVANAEVSLDASGMNSLRKMVSAPDRELVTYTGIDGLFTLKGVSSGSVAVLAKSDQFAASTPAEVTLLPGDHARGIELYLREGAQVTGEIYDKQGDFAVGYLVQATHIDNYAQRVSTTDDEGKFMLSHLDPGPWQILAIPRSTDLSSLADPDGDAATGALFRSLEMASCELKNGESTHLVIGARPKNPVTVSGHITHAGEPVTDGKISFLTDGGQLLTNMRVDTLSSSGAYSVQLEHAGSFLILLARQSGGSATTSALQFLREIPEQEEVVLDFELPNGRISGRVFGADGSPAADVQVTVADDVSTFSRGGVFAGNLGGGQHYLGKTNSAGEFEVDGLRSGTYRVAVGGTPVGGIFGDRAQSGRIVRPGLVLGVDEHLKLDPIELTAPGHIEVRVVDTEGSPVSEATIFARDAEGRPVDLFSWLSTDVGGVAVYDGLAPGRYSVSARAGSFASEESLLIEVSAGAAASAKLILQPGTKIRARVLGPGGTKLSATYAVLDDADRELQNLSSFTEARQLMTSDEEWLTEAIFGPYPPGRYKVLATLEDGRILKKPVSLRGQEERRVTLRVR